MFITDIHFLMKAWLQVDIFPLIEFIVVLKWFQPISPTVRVFLQKMKKINHNLKDSPLLRVKS